MIKILSNSEMQELDRHTIEVIKIPGLVLMENAGLKSAQIIEKEMQEQHLAGPVHVYCGKGNNGGDGYVIARYFQDNGYEVQVFSVGNLNDLKGDAKTNYIACKNLGVPVATISTKKDLSKIKSTPAVIVDALLGTGIKGAVTGLYREVIEFINRQARFVAAVDIPSGLNGDLAEVPGACVRADLTLTMAFPKRAHIFYPARKQAGRLEIIRIGIPQNSMQAGKIKLNLVEDSDISLPALEADTHKYRSGKLFILAASAGMTGAATLSAQAALQTGVGLVYVGIPRTLNPVMETKLTEALTTPLPETACHSLATEALPKIKDRIDWADAVVIGPGIGRNEETMQVVRDSILYCAEKNKPALLDADALFAISEKPSLLKKLNSGFLLTPHHGEFLRFVNCEKEELLARPWQIASDFMKTHKFVLNLKGVPSMTVENKAGIFVNNTGNQSLAKGGSGDVLSGLAGGLLARGISAFQASITANYIHGYAADICAAEKGITSSLPGDLLEFIPTVINFLQE